MTHKVEIIGAPGLADGYAGEVVIERYPAVDNRGDLTVIRTEAGEYLVVPSSTVHDIPKESS